MKNQQDGTLKISQNDDNLRVLEQLNDEWIETPNTRCINEWLNTGLMTEDTLKDWFNLTR